MANIWPQETMRELLALAATSGRATASLTSADEARLFRYAIYNFRNNNQIHADLEITLDDNKIILTKKEPASVTIHRENKI
jgi:hypothetical protein